jgi:hypothetical protein
MVAVPEKISCRSPVEAVLPPWLAVAVNGAFRQIPGDGDTPEDAAVDWLAGIGVPA